LTVKLRRRQFGGARAVSAIAAAVGLSLSAVPEQAQTAAAALSAQSPAASQHDAAPEAKRSFDVISIRRSKPETPPGFTLEHGRLSANLNVLGYIEFAYNLMPSPEQADAMLAHAPKWVSTDNFQIDAVAEGDPPKDQVRRMVQSLLADRFQLQVHTATAKVPVLAFILEKPGATGPALRPHAEGPPCDPPLPPQDPRAVAVGNFPTVCEQVMAIDKPHGAVLVAARNTTIGQIATLVSSVGRLSRPVVDQTGLGGRFDFTLEFTPERKGPPPPQPAAPPDDFPGTTLLEALHEQLGLKLKTAKAPVDTLVIDHVERPSEN
jgi:bla regulator protein blaR1